MSVKGDPLLLLSKRSQPVQNCAAGDFEADVVLAELLTLAAKSSDYNERTPERLYSRFVARYLENGLSVPMDAAGFYEKARPLLQPQ